jgi:ribosome recycling factor
MATDDFSEFTEKARGVSEWLKKELSGIRTSRASPAILDGVLVLSYGAKVPLRHAAAITVEDARTLRIAPFDQNQTKEVEKAIAFANLGLSVVSDEHGVRAGFPELTEERRLALRKTAKERLEQSRVSLRKLRDDAWRAIERKEKEGGMGEDEKFRLKNELQKLVDSVNKELTGAFERKEKEIMS